MGAGAPHAGATDGCQRPNAGRAGRQESVVTQTERIGYPILGVVQQIVALCDNGLGEWCHWGATTQDITDTATVMQIRAALDLIEADMEAIANRAGVRVPAAAGD